LSYGRIEISTIFKTLGAEITPAVKLQKDFGDESEEGGMAEDKFWGRDRSIVAVQNTVNPVRAKDTCLK
jgi:hypothetical protein